MDVKCFSLDRFRGLCNFQCRIRDLQTSSFKLTHPPLSTPSNTLSVLPAQSQIPSTPALYLMRHNTPSDYHLAKHRHPVTLLMTNIDV
jgi:hypothetical protein